MAAITHLEPARAGRLDFAIGAADRAKGFEQARRHTRSVRLLRLALPGCAASVVAVYVAIVLNSLGLVGDLPQVDIPRIIPENLTMDNPRYEGFNRDGGSYVVTAKTAVQDLTDLSHVKLNDINGDLVDGKKQKTNLKAAHGSYNSKTNELELYDGIDVVAESGMHAKMSRATVHTKENIVLTKEPVTVEFPAGTVRSKEMTLHSKSRQVTFLDTVVAHLVPRTVAAAKPAVTPKKAGDAPMISAANGPIDITSNRLDIEDGKKIATFSGAVRAAQGDAVLETAALEVTYESADANAPVADPAAAGTKIRSIASRSPIVMTRAPQDRVTGESLDYDALKEVAVVTGSVLMTSGSERQVSGRQATIDQKADTVLLTGDVVAIQGRNELKGERLLVERATGHTQLTSPAEPGSTEPGRISSRFYRSDADTDKQSKAAQARAGPDAMAAAGIFKTNPAAPIDVEADRLNVDDHAKTAVFQGDVHAAQSEFVIRTSEMRAYYSGQAGLAEPAAAGEKKTPAQLTRIEARGKVIVTSKGGQNATGDWADFDVKSNMVTVGGDVVLTQEKNVVHGTRLVIDMATGQSMINNDPGAAWSAKADPNSTKPGGGIIVQGPSASGRPSAIFYPKEKKAAAKQGETPAPQTPQQTSPDEGWQARSPAP